MFNIQNWDVPAGAYSQLQRDFDRGQCGADHISSSGYYAEASDSHGNDVQANQDFMTVHEHRINEESCNLTTYPDASISSCSELGRQ